MKQIAALLVLVLVSAPNACGQTVRIATYNLNWANRHGDQVLAAIATADPDVLCLQETTQQFEAFLRTQLSDRYPHFYSAGHEGKYAAERFALASKFKLGNVSYSPPGAGLFGFCSADVRLDGQPIRIVNVHLTPFRLRRGGELEGAMAAVSGTEDLHAQEIAAIVSTVAVDEPTIIAGDFNSLSTFVAPKRLLELGFVDSFASRNPAADSHPTWHWPTRMLKLALRIDYIFHTPHFETTRSEVIRRNGSDHSLVVSELQLVQPHAQPNPVPINSAAP